MKLVARAGDEVTDSLGEHQSGVLHARPTVPRLGLADLQEESVVISEQISRRLQIGSCRPKHFANTATPVEAEHRSANPTLPT